MGIWGGRPQDYNSLRDQVSQAAAKINDYVQLGGEINPSLLELKHLKSLNLSLNDFNGTSIPEFIGSLKSLQYLNLSNAGFGGKLPNQLDNLSNLYYLSLSGLYMVPVEIGNLEWLSHLSHLEHLDLSHNSFQGPIPRGLRNLTMLTDLHLSFNWFNTTIPDWLNSFNHLKHLDLNENTFHGTISATIDNPRRSQASTSIETTLKARYPISSEIFTDW
ncbi:hypothetical protein GIB67_040755 [Kingdonia uniflora]|uniref:Disease resistance R13L4/SHOC-2-like LRR domain-containing protein n=1 Tax=Kingdonia uniflora TaxID=39325 RepID=A0A7J7KUG0_9MAGN|nr:hypothetical protein GIB67_040755 [Kingdonia uniflora]